MPNDDGLEAGDFVTREEHDRVVNEYRTAHTMVIRGDAADLDAALAILRE